MDTTLSITRNGAEIASVMLEEGSKVVRDLMGDHYVKLIFTLDEPVLLEVNDTVETTFGKFCLLEPYRPDYNTDTGGYEYEVQFDAHYMRFSQKIFRYTPASASSEVTFTLTAKLTTHINLVLANINALVGKDDEYAYNGNEYTYTTDDLTDTQAAEADTYHYISFDSMTITDALTTICEEFDVEWWFEDNVLHIGRCELSGDAVTFEQNENVKEMTREESTGTYANRVIAFGSTKNIPDGYYDNTSADDTINGIVSQRLRLPSSSYPNGYIQTDDVSTEADAVEYVFIDESIYPETDLEVTSVTTYTDTVEDDDGEEVTETFYRITDDKGFFKESYILEGETLHVVFNSGSLAGMDFEVEFVEDETFENGYYYEVVVNDDYGIDLPNGTLHPEEGDEFTLYNWDATAIGDTGLIDDAEERLAESAKEKLEELSRDPYTYKCTLYPDSVVSSDDTLSTEVYDLGQKVTLVNDAFFEDSRTSRITGYEIPLDIEADEPVYSVGEYSEYSLTGDLQEQIDEIDYNGTSYETSSSSSGSSVYHIKSNDSTRPSDYNAYTAKRADINYISATDDDEADGEIRFRAGVKYGDTSYGVDSGGNVEAATVDTTGTVTSASHIQSENFDEDEQAGFAAYRESTRKYHVFTTDLTVWGKAYFNELEIRKLSAIGGTVVLSAAASTLFYVEEYEVDGEMVGWKCFYLADDGTTATQNGWQVGDQARCESFNIEEGTYEGVGNKDYWRCVIAVSSENECIYDDNGDALYDGQKYGWIVLSLTNAQTSDYGSTLSGAEQVSDDYLSTPAADDVIVLMGHQPQSEEATEDIDRMHLIMMSAAEDDGPRITMYKNITTFSLEDCLVARMSPTAWTILSSSFTWIAGDGKTLPQYTYMGEWTDGDTASQYTFWTYDGDLWRYDGEESTTAAPSTESGSGWTRITYTSNIDVDVTSAIVVRATGIEQTAYIDVDLSSDGDLIYYGEDLDVELRTSLADDAESITKGYDVFDGVTFKGVTVDDTSDGTGDHSAEIVLTIAADVAEMYSQPIYVYITYGDVTYRRTTYLTVVSINLSQSVVLDLSNENSVIPTQSDGTLAGDYNFETTEVHLYQGTSDIRDSDDVTWTYQSTECEYTVEDFIITPTSISADSASITVQATYEGTTYTAQYRLTKAYGSVTVYSLILETDVLVRNKEDGELYPEFPAISVKKTTGTSTTVFTSWDDIVAEGLDIRVNGTDVGDSIEDLIDAESPLDINTSILNDESDYASTQTFYLVDSTDGTIHDIEMLPVIEDGTAFSLVLSPTVVAVQCSSDGIITGDIPTVTATMYLNELKCSNTLSLTCTDCTATTDSERRVSHTITITDVTADTASIVVMATYTPYVYTYTVYGTVTITKVYAGVDGEDGEDGKDGKDGDDALTLTFSPSVATIVCDYKGVMKEDSVKVSPHVYYDGEDILDQFLDNDITITVDNDYCTTKTAPGGTITIKNVVDGTDVTSFGITVTVSSGDGSDEITLTSTFPVVKVIDGEPTRTLTLSNDATAVACSSDGTVIGDIETSTIYFYEGSTEILADAIDNGAELSLAATNCTASLADDDDGVARVITVTALTDTTTNSHSVTIYVTYEGEQYTAIYSLTKVCAGVDGAAYAINLTNDMEPVLSDVNGVVLEDSIAGTKATLYYGATDITSSATWTCEATGITATIGSSTGAVEVSDMTADKASVVITATYDGTKYTATYSLYKTLSAKYSIYLTTYAVHVDSDGKVTPDEIVAVIRQETTSGVTLIEENAYTDYGVSLVATYDGETTTSAFSLTGVLSITPSSDHTSIGFYIVTGRGKTSATIDDYTILDAETVPVIYDGSDVAVTTYSLIPSSSVITIAADGTVSPETLSFSVLKTVTTADGATSTTITDDDTLEDEGLTYRLYYVTTGALSGFYSSIEMSYSPSSSTTAVYAILSKDGTTLDREDIAVVSDGSDGEAGADGEDGEAAWNIIFTPSILTAVTDTSGVLDSESSTLSTTVTVTHGSTTATISSARAGTATNCSVSYSDGTFTVTDISTTTYTVDDASLTTLVPYAYFPYSVVAVDGDDTYTFTGQIDITISATALIAQTNTTVNSISTIVGSLETNVDGLKTSYSEITQTVGSISLKVDSLIVSGYNMLSQSYVRWVGSTTSSGSDFADAHTVELVEGTTYTIAANGFVDSTAADAGVSLRVAIYYIGDGAESFGDSMDGQNIAISSTSRTTDSVTFEASYSGTYAWELYLSSATGFGCLMWAALEEGETTHGWTQYEGDADVNANLVPTSLDDWSVSSSASITILPSSDDNAYDGHEAAAISSSSSYLYYTPDITASEPYTLSLWKKGGEAMVQFYGTSILQGTYYDGGIHEGNTVTLPAGDDWTYYSITFTFSDEIPTTRYLRLYGSDDTAYYACVKFEYGGRATDWTSAGVTVNDLLATGIDIESGKITLTASNVIFQDVDGSEAVSILGDNGQITAGSLVTTSGCVSIGDGTIDIRNASGYLVWSLSNNGTFARYNGASGENILWYDDADGRHFTGLTEEILTIHEYASIEDVLNEDNIDYVDDWDDITSTQIYNGTATVNGYIPYCIMQYGDTSGSTTWASGSGITSSCPVPCPNGIQGSASQGTSYGTRYWTYISLDDFADLSVQEKFYVIISSPAVMGILLRGEDKDLDSVNIQQYTAEVSDGEVVAGDSSGLSAAICANINGNYFKTASLSTLAGDKGADSYYNAMFPEHTYKYKEDYAVATSTMGYNNATGTVLPMYYAGTHALDMSATMYKLDVYLFSPFSYGGTRYGSTLNTQYILFNSL